MNITDEWKGNKAQRAWLKARLNGKCAYCGIKLQAMHADHLLPVVRLFTDPWGKPLPSDQRALMFPNRNQLWNMMPACAPCNLHKGGYKLEAWRDIIQRSADIVAKQTSTFRAGERFGVIKICRDPVVFHFESRGYIPFKDPES